MSQPRGHPTSRRSSSTSVEQHPFPDRRNFAERTAALSAPAHRLHQVILQAFLTRGCAPRLADLRPVARASGIGLEHLLAELAVHDVIQRTADGAIAVAYPFSGSPTAHLVQLADGPTVFAMCVIDALGLPFMARRAATIRTQDPFDATLITIAIGCGPTGKPVSSHVRWLPACRCGPGQQAANRTGDSGGMHLPLPQCVCQSRVGTAVACRTRRPRCPGADPAEGRERSSQDLRCRAAGGCGHLPVPKHQPAGRREE